jgi:hypothetical protein
MAWRRLSCPFVLTDEANLFTPDYHWQALADDIFEPVAPVATVASGG